MATQFGTAAEFGMTTQVGVISDGSTWNYEQDVKRIKDEDGDDTTASYYNERITGSLTGYIPQTSPFSTTIAAAITISDAPTDFLVGAVGTTTICESVTVSKAPDDFQKIDIEFSNYAGISP